MATDNMPQMFLEDVGSLVHSHDGQNVWLIKDLDQREEFEEYMLPHDIYVVDFPALGVGQRFLLSRHLCGPDKFFMLQQIGHAMAKICKRTGMFDGEKLAQFIILYGGEAYNMHFCQPPLVDGIMIDSTYIKYERVEDSTQQNGFRIKKLAFSGKWWQDNIWLCLEECVASGSTVAHFAKEGFVNHKPKKLFIFPACGSFFGIQGIYQACLENGVEFVPVFNSALIDVAPEGLKLPYTDLGLRPRTIMTREFCAAARHRYQDTSLCFVGDIGDSIHRTKRYIMETLDDMRLIGFDFEREDWSRWNPNVFSEYFRQKLAEVFPETSQHFETFLFRDSRFLLSK